jgi:acyl carrier protein
VSYEQIEDNLRFVQDLGADSLDLIETVIECEKKLDIQIDDQLVARIKTVGDLYNAIEITLTEYGV